MLGVDDLANALGSMIPAAFPPPRGGTCHLMWRFSFPALEWQAQVVQFLRQTCSDAPSHAPPHYHRVRGNEQNGERVELLMTRYSTLLALTCRCNCIKSTPGYESSDLRIYLCFFGISR